MNRSELREHIFRMLFRIEFNSEEEMKEQEDLYFELLGETDEQDKTYILNKYKAVVDKKEEIDGLLNEYTTGWKTSRMNRVDLTILRLAVYEMKWDEEVPTGVAINEAVELAKKYSSDEGPSFVNGVLAKLAHFAKEYKDMPCMAYTHCQPAQLTTVGKRATLWMNEFYMDLQEIDHQISQLALRGVKGTTGTQASFMELFKGDADKIRAVDASIAREMGFDPKAVIPVSGQTYSRKVDAFVLNALAGIGQSCMKFATDLRLLANFKEMEEPFEKNQIGSSAMPYKRNPMRCERICALSRYLMVDVLNPSFTTGTQWFERTLDDSANKRIAMAEGFLAADAILNILLNVSDGLVVYPKVVRSRVMAELPFMASENIMMKAVKKGGDRQELHERIREHSMEAGRMVKAEGRPNDLLERIAADPAFGTTMEELQAIMNPKNFVGRAPEQVSEFLDEVIQPILDENKEALGMTSEINV